MNRKVVAVQLGGFKNWYLWCVDRAQRISKYGTDDIFAVPDDDDFAGPEKEDRIPTYREHKWALKETRKIFNPLRTYK